MRHIISWKVRSGLYAYMFKYKDSYISNEDYDKREDRNEIWSSALNDINSLTTKELYKARFEEVQKAVKKYAPDAKFEWDDSYWNATGADSGSTLPSNIILMYPGKDNGGSGSGSGSGEGSGLGDTELISWIEGKIDDAKKAIEAQNENVKNFIHDEVTNQISEAKVKIEETQKDLTEIREEFTEDLKNAKEALEAAKDLFGEGNIDAQKIENVFNTVSEHKEWFNEYSGNVASLVYDYDEVLQEMGGIGVASAASKGLFSMFAESLNTTNNTIGSVERTMNASLGTIKDMATWYDANSGIVSDASRLIVASAGVIADTVRYMEESGITNEVSSQLDARQATIIDTIKSETTSGLTYIENVMNGLSAYVATEIVHLDSATSAITSVGERLNAAEGEISTWITKTTENMEATDDLREHWSIESGKLSTVAHLTAQTDADGNVMYFVSGSTGVESQVYRHTDGKYYSEPDGKGYLYEDSQVYVHFSDTMASYIQQLSSAITLSVMGPDNMTAAIKVAIQEDVDGNKAIIQMVADEVVITGDMIAKAIYSEQANIGGILIGEGKVESWLKTADGRPYFRLDGNTGSFYAQNAQINGSITATSLTLGANYGNVDISGYVNGVASDKVDSLRDSMQGFVAGYMQSDEFKEAIVSGYVTEESVKEWIENLQDQIPEGLSWEAISAITKQMIGAQINMGSTAKTDEYGRTIYEINIGGNKYSWTTVDGEKFLLTGFKYGDGTEKNFIFTKDGLLQANNAIIHGQIVATSGTFQGRVEANEGFFHGSVSADSGYFKGEVTATSLKLGSSYGNKDIKEYIDGRIPDIPEGGLTEDAVKEVIREFTSTEDFKNAITDGYITSEEFEEWAKNSLTGFTEEQINALKEALGESTVVAPKPNRPDGSGGTIHTVTIGGVDYEWTTFETEDVLILNKKVGGEKKNFTLSKDGLLEANNAVIYGEIHAQAGYIGDIELKDDALVGENFKMSKTGLTITGSLIQPYTNIDIKNPSFFSTGIGKESGNFFFSGNTNQNNLKLPSLICDDTQIGRRISITNNAKGIASGDFSLATMTLPSGYYFFEDGRRTHTLSICNEVVDLIGYGDSSSKEFFGWSVLSRMNFMTENTYGHTLQTLCTGIINMGSGTMKKFSSCDGTVFLRSQNLSSTNESRNWDSSSFRYVSSKTVGQENGIYKTYIRFPYYWFDRFTSSINGLSYNDNPDLFVQITPYGSTPRSVSYYNTSSSGFTICSNGIDDVSFTVYNRGGWRSLSKIEFFDAFVDITELDWEIHIKNGQEINGIDYKTVTLYTTVNNTTLSVNIDADKGRSFDYDVEEFFDYNLEVKCYNIKVIPTSYDAINVTKDEMTLTCTYNGQSITNTVNLIIKPS